MGYHTRFRGELKFTTELKASQIAYLDRILGEDARNHPEWNASGIYYIDLVFTDNFDGIKWDDETEKTYDMEDIISLVIRLMQDKWPEFGLNGRFSAQGEEFGDRYEIIVKDNVVKKKSLEIEGRVIECPHCEQKFELTEDD